MKREPRRAPRPPLRLPAGIPNFLACASAFCAVVAYGVSASIISDDLPWADYASVSTAVLAATLLVRFGLSWAGLIEWVPDEEVDRIDIPLVSRRAWLKRLERWMVAYILSYLIGTLLLHLFGYDITGAPDGMVEEFLRAATILALLCVIHISIASAVRKIRFLASRQPPQW